MSTIYLIRHGQASFGTENYDKLSEIGIEQSRILAEHFVDRGIFFDTIYTGTMVRQLETATELINLLKERNLTAPQVKQLDGFNEYDPQDVLSGLIPIMIKEDPAFENRVKTMFNDRRSFQLVFEKIMLRWVTDDYDLPGLFKWGDYTLDVNKGIDGVMNSDGRGKTIAVFTSGGPICVVAQKALNLSHSAAIQLNWQIVNSSVTRFKCTTDRIMIFSFNEISHLESNGRKGLITYR